MEQSLNSTNDLIKQTAKHSLIYLPSIVLPALFGVILIRVYTTIFTHEEYGYYNIALSTLGLIKVFSTIWLSTSALRFFLNYRNNEKQSDFYSTIGFSSLVGSVLLACLALALNWLIVRNNKGTELFSLLNLVIIASIFASIFETFVVVFRAGLKPKKYTYFWTTYAIGKPIIGLLLIFSLHIGVSGIFWGFLIASCVLDGILWKEMELSTFLNINAISFRVIKEFGKYGIPLAISSFSFWILSLSDRYLIEYFRGSAEVGLYSVGYSISEKTLQFAYMGLMLAAYPILIDNWEKNGEKSTQNLISELTRYYFILFAPLLAILISIPKEILLLFSGTAFIEGARVLPFIALGVFFAGLAQYILKGFELRRQSVEITKIALSAGAVNISLNLLLIPKFGYWGASISCVAAYGWYLSFSIYSARKALPWLVPYKSIGKVFLSIAAMMIFLLLSRHFIQNIFLKIMLLINQLFHHQ